MSLEWYLAKALNGNPIAQYNIGVCYKTQCLTRKNLSRAFFWFLKSASQGFVLSQYNVAVCYEMGIGVKKSYKKAMIWYEKAAEQGHDQACYCLQILREKKGLKKNQAEIESLKTEVVKLINHDNIQTS